VYRLARSRDLHLTVGRSSVAVLESKVVKRAPAKIAPSSRACAYPQATSFAMDFHSSVCSSAVAKHKSSAFAWQHRIRIPMLQESDYARVPSWRFRIRSTKIYFLSCSPAVSALGELADCSSLPRAKTTGIRQSSDLSGVEYEAHFPRVAKAVGDPLSCRTMSFPRARIINVKQ